MVESSLGWFEEGERFALAGQKATGEVNNRSRPLIPLFT